jgi:transcriptional regulator
MYLPSHFEETRTEVLHTLLRTHPLATLVTQTARGLEANHIPLYLRVHGDGATSLVGHVARSNPIWKETNFAVPVLAIFQGPQHYISPSWYATKQEHGKVVPTWNYAVVHARGTLQVRDDAVWIFQQMKELTAQQESTLEHPWHVEDAPADYTERMVSAVVGIEIPVTTLIGKWKVSQNQPPANQATVVQALQQIASNRDTPHFITDAAAMAALVGGKT